MWSGGVAGLGAFGVACMHMGWILDDWGRGFCVHEDGLGWHIYNVLKKHFTAFEFKV